MNRRVRIGLVGLGRLGPKGMNQWYANLTELFGVDAYFQQPNGDTPVYVEFRIGDYQHEFGIIEYPDSDKIGVWGRHDESLDHVIRRSPDLDYWDGELL